MKSKPQSNPKAAQQMRGRSARTPIAVGIAFALGTPAGLVYAAPGASDASPLAEITVTARKRDESLQDVPVSVQALSTDALQSLGVKNFEDYAALLPSVSFKSLGVPGSATVLMRGVSDGGDGNSSGSQPSVGMYLDEAPVTTISSNLDVHIYDIARIEALAGPQGTLFGASAESGLVRIVTNKPSAEKFEARADLSIGGTQGGAGSRTVEGFVNLPIGNKAAIRLVGWSIDEGGWIDNVPGTRTYKLEGGYGYNENNFGRVATLNNTALVGQNQNDLKKDGYRAALKVDLADHWTATVGVTSQNTRSDGVWESDPANTGNSHSIQRFTAESRKDEFTQASWTVEGQIANQHLTYAGSHLDRHVDYVSDYSKYGEDAYFVPYYACDYSATGPNLKTQSATDCTSLYEYYVSHNRYNRTSHELRLQSAGEGRLQYVAGIFYQSAEHVYQNLWIQPGMSPTLQVPGYGIPGVFFRTDQQRKDTQKAAFGELYFDFTSSLRATIGARRYDETSAVKGVVGWGPSLFDPTNPTAIDTFSNSSANFTGQIYKANLAWKLSPDHLVYVTYSEGYRPGGENRDPGLVAKVGTQAWQPDKLKNYEIGWKTSWLDKRLRWNGAMYLMDWDKVQYTQYDFFLSPCCGNVYNLSTARVKGIETDIAWAVGGGVSVAASLSYNDAKTTGDFLIQNLARPTKDVFAVPSGTELPNVPKLKANARLRYDFRLGEHDVYMQANDTYVGSSQSRIRLTERYPQKSYNLLNLGAGVGFGRWGAELYLNNVTNESAELFVHPRKYESSVVTNRPFSYGLKLWMTF